VSLSKNIFKSLKVKELLQEAKRKVEEMIEKGGERGGGVGRLLQDPQLR
jgi:hypothetical protein